MRVDGSLLLALLVTLLAGACLGAWWSDQVRRRAGRRWPRQWHLSARPLFNTHELSLYRELRLALPQHVILSKVGVLRFCHASDANEVHDWHDRLQGVYVSMVVCTPSGTVISAIDIVPATSKHLSRRQQLKETVLETCRVRYLRCSPGQWAQGASLASWVLGQSGSTQPGVLDTVHDAGDQLARKLKARRAERAARWADSSFAHDSFFAGDSRFGEAAPNASTGVRPARSPARR